LGVRPKGVVVNEIPSTLYIAFGTVLAALISAVISLVSITLSKDVKVSELRQLWINDLRNELSSLISIINRQYGEWYLHEDKSPEGIKELQRNQIVESQKCDEITHKLRMRLNPLEHQKLIALVLELENSLANADVLYDRNRLDELFDKYTAESQLVLKAEWVRVKEGEGSFATAKKLSKWVIGICLVAVIGLSILA
jgi:hypothetical protein